MKRIYISIPISGKDLRIVKAHAYSIKLRVREIMKEVEECVVETPFDVCKDCKPPFGLTESQLYAFYMGKDIEAILNSDIVIFCDGWDDSKGCQLEEFAVNNYGKEIFFEKDLNNMELYRYKNIAHETRQFVLLTIAGEAKKKMSEIHKDMYLSKDLGLSKVNIAYILLIIEAYTNMRFKDALVCLMRNMTVGFLIDAVTIKKLSMNR